ncbi:MAG: class I SAM-dependent methyltransferase [Bacteroidia bacterium]
MVTSSKDNSSAYRGKLYENYFETQVSRIGAEGVAKLKNDLRLYRKEILPLLSQDRQMPVLDIGCGYGSLLMLLKQEKYQHLQGIDLSPEQVKKAEEFGVEDVQHADVFDFLYDKKEEFGAITGIDIIEHFNKNELLRLLGIIRNSLKPGGICIFRTPNMDAPFGSTYAYGDFTHEVLLNYSSAVQLMRSAGFVEVQVLPSTLEVSGAAKKILQRMAWTGVKFFSRLILFATGKSSRDVILTPNLIITGRK